MRPALVVLLGTLVSCPGGGGYSRSQAMVALEVTPAGSSIALGTAQQLEATGLLPDGSQQDLTDAVVWESSDPTVATVDNAPGSEGLATSVAVGAVTVTALHAASGTAGTATLTVTAAELSSLAVTPTNPSIALGTDQPFAATGTFTDGTTRDLTTSAAWGSSDPGVATIGVVPGSEGLATGLAVGATEVSAFDPASGIGGTTMLTVTSATLSSIALTPTAPSIALGTGQAFAATGTYSDGTTQDLTSALAWSSTDPGVATVSDVPGTKGLVTSLAVGATTVRAVHAPSGIEGTTVLTVTPAVLLSIGLTPGAPSIALGTDQPFAATGTFTDGTTQDLTDSLTWSSTDPGVATVSNAAGSEGLAASLAVGATTITALHPPSGIGGSTILTVTPAALVSVALAPAAPAIALGTDQAFTATGTYTDASTQDLTTALTWSSTDPGVATVSNAAGSEGLAASLAVGTTTITALHPPSGIDGSTILTVTPAALVSVALAPAAPTIALGTDQAFTATGTYTDASTQDLTTALTWSSTDPGVATVSNAAGSEGLATSLAVGTTTITALHPPSGIDGSTLLTVGPAALVSLAVTPVTPAVEVGTDVAFTATGTLSDASTQDWTAAATWSSTDTGVATISNAAGSEGLASTGAVGTTTISALDAGSGIGGATTLSVAPRISLRGASSAGADSGLLSLVIVTPPAAQAGDVLIASIAVRPSTAVIATPVAAWNLVRRIDNTGGNSSSLAVYSRVVAAGEPPAHAWTFSASTGSAGGVAAFAAVDIANPIDVEDGQTTPSGLAHTAPGVTTTVPNTMLVSAHAYSSCAAWDPPGGMTEAFEQFSLPAENTAGISVVGTYALQGAAAATGPRTATAGDHADTGNAHLLALRRAPLP